MALGWANPNRRRFKRSQKAERAAAGALGGRVLPQSGAQPVTRIPGAPSQRGDFRTPTLHCEHKRTELGAMAVQRAWFTKVAAGAALALRVPAVVLLFETRTVDPEWIFLPRAYFTAKFPNREWFRGEVRVTDKGSLRLHADRLPAAPEGFIPVLAIEWREPGADKVSTWIGAPLPRVQEALRE